MIPIAALAVSFATSLALVPLVRWLSFRVGRVSMPRKDRWHSRPTPALGGVGMFVAFGISMLVMILIRGDWTIYQTRWSMIISAVLMFALGLYDDFKTIKPPTKLIGQLLAATIVIFWGDTRIDFFPWPIANILLTYFWLIGITNAINLLDNMDGLAGGIALIASGMLAYFFWKSDQLVLLQLTLTLSGAILGFLVFNFPPARIFMGDSGSMFLGFLMAALAIARQTQASNVFAALGVPTLLLLLPILDTSLVAITRMLRGQSPIQGGTDHTSHRLIAFGLSERQAILVLYSVALVSGVAAASIEALDYDLSLVIIPILLIGLALFVAYLGRLRMVSEPSQTKGSLARLVGNLTYKRRVFEIILDLMLIGSSYYLAFWTRFGLDMTTQSMDLFLQSWPMALGLAYLAFFSFGIYRGVWRYVGLNDLLRYVGAVVATSIAGWIISQVLFSGNGYGVDIFLLFAIFLLLGLAGSRVSFQVLDRWSDERKNKAGKISVLIYGADDAGELALRWMLRNPEMGYKPVGFIDDQGTNRGKLIHDVRVLGGVEQINAHLIDIQGVVVTNRALLATPQGTKLTDKCRERGIWIRWLRIEFEPVD